LWDISCSDRLLWVERRRSSDRQSLGQKRTPNVPFIRFLVSARPELPGPQFLIAVGCVAAGAYADLIVVDGDPLSDIALLAQHWRRLSLILRNGEPASNRLT